jgi:hypothetical protein
VFDSIFSFFEGSPFSYAGGGDPPVGVPSIVGENGPELFVPKTAGTVIPNDALGGGSVTIHQTLNFGPGVDRAMVRTMVQQAKAETIATIQQMNQHGDRRIRAK